MADADNDLQIWISFDNEPLSKRRLPVNPEIIRVTTTHGYDDVMLTQLGEYTVVGNEMLREYSISSFFPRDYSASYCEYKGFQSPYEFVAILERWIASRKPIRLTVTGTINTLVTIRSFTHEERAGHVGDVFYELSLKEYRLVEFKRVSEKKSGTVTTLAANSKRSDTKGSVKSYKIVSGDSLSKIAFKVYTDADRWRDIYNANKTAIGANPNTLKVGQTLVIP